MRADLVGTRAEVVVGVTPTGELAALQPTTGVVVFLTSSCLACREVWSALADPGDDDVALAAAVTPDPSLEDRRAVAALAPAGAPVVMSTAAWQRYGVQASPWAAVVVGGLIVAEGPVAGWAEVAAMVRGGR